MDINKNIKDIMYHKRITLTELNKMLNEKNGTSYSKQNLSRKLNSSTIRYNLVEDILELLDCRIILKPKK